MQSRSKGGGDQGLYDGSTKAVEIKSVTKGEGGGGGGPKLSKIARRHIRTTP